MDRQDRGDPAGGPHGGSGDGLDRIVGLLRSAATAIDQMSRDRSVTATPRASMELAEASFGVHRALLALREAGCSAPAGTGIAAQLAVVGPA